MTSLTHLFLFFLIFFCIHSKPNVCTFKSGLWRATSCKFAWATLTHWRTKVKSHTCVQTKSCWQAFGSDNSNQTVTAKKCPLFCGWLTQGEKKGQRHHTKVPKAQSAELWWGSLELYHTTRHPAVTNKVMSALTVCLRPNMLLNPEIRNYTTEWIEGWTVSICFSLSCWFPTVSWWPMQLFLSSVSCVCGWELRYW